MATYISKQSGLWSSATTWLTAANGAVTPTADAGSPPQSGAGDRFIIRGGNTVTYDVVGEFGNDGSYFTNTDAKFLSNAICLSGTGSTLKAHRTNTTSLSCRGSIFVGYGSIFDWGTTPDPVTANAELVFGTYSSTISPTISARTGRCGLFARIGVSTNYHQIKICGNSKTRNTTLSGVATVGTSLLTASDVTGWQVGDKIIIEPHTLNSSTFINMPISAYNISAINGNVITLDRNLPYTYPSGLSVGNFSSNITYKSAHFVNGTTPVACGPQILVAQNTLAEYTIKNVSFENLTQPTFDNDNVAPQSTFGAIYSDIGNGLVPVTIENISFLSDKNYAVNNIGYLNKSAALHTIKNYAAAEIFPTGIGGSTFVFTRFGPRLSVSDSVSYRSFYSFSCDQTNTDELIIKNVKANSTGILFAGNFSVNNLKVNSCTFRYTRSIFAITFISNASITDTTFIGTNNSFYRFTESNNIGSWAFMTFNNPTFTNVYRPEPITLGATNTFSDSSYFNLYNLNSNPIDNRRYNSFYSLSSDYTQRNRSLASYKVKASVANNQYYFTETTDGFAGSPKRFIGYIKYDSVYGTATLPHITFTDASQTVTQTFSCSPTPNIWQKFDLSLTPASNGLITMTFTGQTSSTTANAYLDGVPFYPITPKARHYGFNFDETVPNRTIDTLTTLTENQVSTISTVNNLDYLYDISNYWSVTNPSLTAYTDLYTQDGNILDFGSKNIVVDNSASTGFAYASASNTLTIKTPLLSSGSNFIGLRTTGNIYLSSGSTIGEIDIYGNAFQATPVSLSGIYMEGTLSYNTNSNITIEYTNCTMDTVQNDGTGIVTIKKTNSTIANGLDAEIADFIPTILNVTLNGGYLAVYDDTGTRQYYQNTDGTIVLPSNATGTWTYKIARYGYQFNQGSFIVDPNTGATIEINPNYVPDNFVTSDLATVAGYGDLNTSEKIYNYLNYWTTTSSGIDYVPFYSKAFGSITINKNVVLDATAVNILSYDGSSILTLKCSGLNEDILFASNLSITNVNGTTYSDDVKIRAANLNSELILGGITSFTLYPTQSARDNNTSIGPVLTGTIDRFLYGSVSTGVTLSGGMYARVLAAGTTLLYENTFLLGRNELEFGTTGSLQQIISNQKIMNIGIQKASKLIPYTTNI